MTKCSLPACLISCHACLQPARLSESLSRALRVDKTVNLNVESGRTPGKVLPSFLIDTTTMSAEASLQNDGQLISLLKRGHNDVWWLRKNGGKDRRKEGAI